MPTNTTTYSFQKPVVGADEDSWGGYLNSNWDKVDDLFDGTTAITGIDINSGTIDGVVIGGSSAAAGTFTTLTASTSITGTLATAAQPNITSVGSLTALDVTGTITSDGLTVDGSGVEVISVNSTQNGAQINFDSASTSVDWSIGVSNNADGDFLIYQSGSGSGDINLYTGGLKRQEINRNGSISFFEDTGTTAKFFWDASAESLGIGTTSLTTSDGSNIELSSATSSRIILDSTGTGGRKYTMASGLNGSLDFYDYDAAAYRLRIDSSGNVGIGVVPSAPLHVSGNGRFDNSATTPVRLHINNSGSNDYASLYADTASAYKNLVINPNGGNVGIGTSSPENFAGFTTQTINGSTGSVFAMQAGGVSGTARFVKTASIFSMESISAVPIVFFTNNSERMRIDSSGNLLVGKTSANTSTVGVEALANGEMNATVDGGRVGLFNRLNSDGDIVQFRKDGTTVGSIGATNNNVFVNASGGNYGILKVNGNNRYVWYEVAFYPEQDNVRDLGTSTQRWDDIYATNGTIQTSDEREKQDIRSITDAEARVAQACKGLLKAYRWKDKVAEKGDDARIHFGIIAQDLKAAFEAEGLDAGKYAMFIHTTWWESTEVIPAVEAQEAVYETQTDEDGNEVQVLVSEAVEAQPERTVTHHHETQGKAPEGAVQRDRMGVRYPELLAFIIAAI